jgi:hypothetical protein
MLFLKRGLMAAGALALVAMLLNLVAPNAAHALVATAVQVMNTSATPVMSRDVDVAARGALRLVCSAYSSSCTTGTVPPGFTFVLDSYAVYGQAAPNTTISTYATLNFTGAPTVYLYNIPLASTGGLAYMASGNLTAYVSAGAPITMGFGSTAVYVQACFTGHLVSTP